MKQLDHSFDNKWVKVLKICFVNEENLIKLNNIGLYKNVIFYVKKAPNKNKVIHLIINNLEYVLRLKDAKNIWVEEINNENNK